MNLLNEVQLVELFCYCCLYFLMLFLIQFFLFQLPGRTDNEIKNYWNTRIKRQQRAGLPLYPPELCLQALNEGQQNQNSSEWSGGDTRPNDVLQTSNYDIPEVFFDNLEANHGPFAYAPALPDISGSGIPTQALRSLQNYNFMPPAVHQARRPCESVALLPGFLGSDANVLPSFDPIQIGSCKNIRQPFGPCFPYDADPNRKNPALFGVSRTGRYAFLNNNFSASKPLSEAAKLELPSLQDPEAVVNGWGTCPPLPPPPPLESIDAYIQSPPATQVQSDSSPWNSGLLEEVIHGFRAKNQSSDMSFNSAAVTPADVSDHSTLELCEAQWGDYHDHISPLDSSTASVFSECTHISGSSLDESPPVKALPGEFVCFKGLNYINCNFSPKKISLVCLCSVFTAHLGKMFII